MLTRRELEIPNGTILEVESLNGQKQKWMVWWLERIESSGYNRYVVLKMTHLIVWRDTDNNEHEQWAYFSGPGTSKISDAVKSSFGYAKYLENNNLHMFITSYNKNLSRDAYFVNKQGETEQGYVIKEVDFTSTPGVAYVSVDPSYIRDEAEKPIMTEDDDKAEFFWLNGGK